MTYDKNYEMAISYIDGANRWQMVEGRIIKDTPLLIEVETHPEEYPMLISKLRIIHMQRTGIRYDNECMCTGTYDKEAFNTS